MDRRTKKEKLEAMARQSVSPHEAEIAKEKLKTLEEDTKEPPRVVIVPLGFRIKSAEPMGMWYDFSKEEWNVVSWHYTYEKEE